METKELAKQLGISHQMANRYKAKGMPTDSLESAIAWRKSNIDPFRSKTGRIGGNSGVKYQPKKNKGMSYPDIVKMVNELDDHEYKIVTKTLTYAVPVLWFSQIQRLGAAVRDHNIAISAEDLIKVQSILFLMYMIDIDKFLDTESTYALPDTLMIRSDDEAYSSLIKCLNTELNKEPLQWHES